jgi:hypothetical protein
VYENVFLMTEHDTSEEIATAMPTPEIQELAARLAVRTQGPNVVSIPRHIVVGFAATLLTNFDLKNRRLRRPGWTFDRDSSHLKNVNQSVTELDFLRGQRGAEEATFSLLVPPEFNRVLTRKAESFYEGFSGSPSASLLFPDLTALPYDEVADIGRLPETRELRAAIREWDNLLSEEPKRDWQRLGRLLQPLIRELTNELVKHKVTKTKAWLAFLSGLLPPPFGQLASAADVVKAYGSSGVFSAVLKVTKRIDHSRKA